LARLWQHWGVQPAAVTGHSAGEYAAACLAGVMTLPDALSVVLLRGQLFETLPRGGMLAVDLPEAELLAHLDALARDGLALDVAAVNAPDACIASGALPALAALEDKLVALGLQPRRLHIEVAAHSRLLDGVLEVFRQRMQRLRLQAPAWPFVSGLTGNWVAPGELTDPEYWVRHLRHTVRFAQGLETLRQMPGALWLELGPGQGLCALARHQPGDAARGIWPCTGKAHEPQADLPVMLAAAAGLWTRGVALDWPALRADGAPAPRRISLPTYAFERQRHWVEAGVAASAALAPAPVLAAALAPPLLQRLPDLADWFCVPHWAPAALPAKAAAQAVTPGVRWLVFGGSSKLTAEVVLHLLNQGGRVTLVRAGQRFASLIDGSFTMLPGDAGHHAQLFRSLEQSHAWPQHILHLWALDAGPEKAGSFERDAVIPGQALVFDSLLQSARALQTLDFTQPLRLTVLTAGSQVLPGDLARQAALNPAQALALGPCRVIPHELPQISARLVDVLPAEISAKALARRVVAEAMATDETDLVAYRGAERLCLQQRRADADLPVTGAVTLAMPLRRAPSGWRWPLPARSRLSAGCWRNCWRCKTPGPSCSHSVQTLPTRRPWPALWPIAAPALVPCMACFMLRVYWKTVPFTARTRRASGACWPRRPAVRRCSTTCWRRARWTFGRFFRPPACLWAVPGKLTTQRPTPWPMRWRPPGPTAWCCAGASGATAAWRSALMARTRTVRKTIFCRCPPTPACIPCWACECLAPPQAVRVLKRSFSRSRCGC